MMTLQETVEKPANYRITVDAPRETTTMTLADIFDRITHVPGVMGGKPTIRGMRITAGMIVSQINAGESIDELLADFPMLEREDILQAIQYAEWLEGREIDFDC